MVLTDPEAMADFFTIMQARSRSNGANYWGESPDWLMTHPVTITRITEAKDRAARIRRERGSSQVCVRDPDGPAQCEEESAPRPQFGQRQKMPRRIDCQTGLAMSDLPAAP